MARTLGNRLKYWMIEIIRSLGLLNLADYIQFHQKAFRIAKQNRQFICDNRDFPVPPEDLAFDAYNHFNWAEYRDGGHRHAQVFAEIIRDRCSPGSLNILEWGCGPARLIRHLDSLLFECDVKLTGTDINTSTIEWCRANIKGIQFELNQLMPPLPFDDDSFEVCYNFSVLTHLSKEVQKAWVKELDRVLKPGGLLICTTHGKCYTYLLTKAQEKEQFENGEAVIQGNYKEGKKWFFSVESAGFVRNILLRDFNDVLLVTAPEQSELFQDIWVARKPDF